MNGTLTVIRADGSAETRLLTKAPTLEELQEIVGGYIELVPLFENFGDKGCVAFCNEEGKLNGLPINRVATLAWATGGGHMVSDVLVGDVVIVQGDDDLMERL